jgi:hypothetical protein
VLVAVPAISNGATVHESRQLPSWLIFDVGQIVKTEAFVRFTASDAEFIELSELERFDDGSGWSAKIKVSSVEFACHGRPFYFDDLEAFVTELKKAYRELRGTAELRHTYEKDFVCFTFGPRGLVHISGLLIQYGPSLQRLEFAFEADQTFVPPLISSAEAAARQLR